jgi:beta-glucanase (GH16 family)
LIFEDNFDFFDFKKWEHENTLGGGGNWEFQWYTNNRSNSFTDGGNLLIQPTLLSDRTGEGFLTSGVLNIHGGSPADQCSNPAFYGCERGGSPSNIINPIISARLRSINSFSFKYGRLEINAKMPAGDWLWPALWLLPRYNAYGTWPASGEIDLMESRGNLNLVQNGVNIGAEQIGSTLHFGPYPDLNGYPTAHYTRNAAPGNGFNNGFHRYQMEWTPDRITFRVDDVETGTIHAGSGFWNRANFAGNAPGVQNPWRFGEIMAPFDQEFYIIMNNAVGGVAYFPDDASNPGGKPWSNTSPQASTDFWNGRGQWLPTWNLNTNNAALVVDYVRVWAL